MAVKISKTGVAADNTASGSVVVSGNIDEYSVNLVAGVAYQFDVEGLGTGAGTLVSPTLALRDSSANGTSSSYSTPTAGDRRVTYTPTVTATYYVDVGGSGTGTYQFVSAPHDDFNSIGTTVLNPNTTVSGAMQTVDDDDVFAVNLTAGFAYQYDLLGQGTGAGTLASPTLALRDSSANGTSSSYSTPTAGDRRVTYTPTVTATYYVGVSGVGTGTYQLISAPQDEFNNLANGGNVLNIGSTAIGTLQTVADDDTFTVNVVAGQTYQFDVLGQGTGFGTLAGPVLKLLNSLGNRISSGTTVSSGDQRLQFTATTTTAYALDVSGSGTGTYKLISSAPGYPGFSAVDTGTGSPLPDLPVAYSGPVAGLANSFIKITTANLNISVSTPNWFIHSGSGTDGIAASSGINVLDGGTGSNFLTGGTGTDTFFVDNRSAPSDIWSTVVGFHSRDAATVWGVTQSGSTLSWVDNQGAAGFTGLTLHVTGAGVPTASLTLAGYSQADFSNGRLTMSFGSTDASSPYLYIHAT